MCLRLYKGSEREHFKGVVTWMHRNSGLGLLKAKRSLILKKLYAWGKTDLPG